MANLKDTNVNGNLTITNDIVVQNRNILNDIDSKAEISKNITWGQVVLTYYSSDWMTGVVHLSEDFTAQNTNFFFSVMYVSGTVCDNIFGFNWYFIANGVIEIRAHCGGGGLVDGHLLKLSWLAVKGN